MVTKYALSYNNLAKTDEVLDKVVFKTEAEALEFVDWFNKCLENCSYITMTHICEKMGLDVPNEAFDRLGFIRPMEDTNVYYNFHDNVWAINFPMWIKDFSPKGD